jgi:hypothetical protein
VFSPGLTGGDINEDLVFDGKYVARDDAWPSKTKNSKDSAIGQVFLPASDSMFCSLSFGCSREMAA